MASNISRLRPACAVRAVGAPRIRWAQSVARLICATSRTPLCYTYSGCDDATPVSSPRIPAYAGTGAGTHTHRILEYRSPPSRGRRKNGRRTMITTPARFLTALTCLLLATTAARAADVTYERLLNPDKEPQNWLMNHHDFGAQRYSPLAEITKSNVKNMRLLFAVALGGSAG